MKLLGVIETVFEAAAATGGKPTASIAGKVISELPPTTEVITPPARPAPNSHATVGVSINRGRALAIRLSPGDDRCSNDRPGRNQEVPALTSVHAPPWRERESTLRA